MLPHRHGLDFFLNLHIDFFKTGAEKISTLTVKNVHEDHFGKGYIRIYLEYQPVEDMSESMDLWYWIQDVDDRNYMAYHVSSGRTGSGIYAPHTPYADSQVVVYALKLHWKEKLIDETKFINICHRCCKPFVADDWYEYTRYCNRCSDLQT